MTWSEFWRDVASNILARLVGVVVCVPIAIALWIERHRRRQDNVATAAIRNAKSNVGEQQLHQKRAKLMPRENDIGFQQHEPLSPDWDLPTWDAFNSPLADLIDDPEIVAVVAHYFARLALIDAHVQLLLHWGPERRGAKQLREDIHRLISSAESEAVSLREGVLKLV